MMISKYRKYIIYFSTGDDAVLSVGGAISTVCGGVGQDHDTADVIQRPLPLHPFTMPLWFNAL